MDIAVIIPMEEERRLLIENLENVKQSKVAGIEIYDGELYGHHVISALAGIGKVQAAMTTTVICTKYNPDVVINTGSAGGLSTDMGIGDVVVSNRLAYHDVDVSGYEKGQLPGRDRYFIADQTLNQQILSAAKSNGLNVSEGLVVTGDQFIEGDSIKNKILNDFPDAKVSEMEGAAVGQVCTDFEVPFTVIRSVSDNGDKNSAVDFDEFVVKAGENSVGILLSYLKNL